jgi:hypothetical protein
MISENTMIIDDEYNNSLSVYKEQYRSLNRLHKIQSPMEE